jgi:capsular exopolysaccharide synthesis family protein
MSKTFKALMKAAKDKRMGPEEKGAFYLRPHYKHRLPLSSKHIPGISEEYHRLKHSLASKLSGDTGRAILFCSSNNGEGTSTVLNNFAVTLAAGGSSVLIVDANLRNPTAHISFNLIPRQGFTELIMGKDTLSKIIKTTKVNNLSVITHGVHHSNPSRLFESQAMVAIAEKIKTKAEWILFDFPPVNLYNDAISMAGLMGGVVMVVEADKTRWEVAQRAKRRLEDDGGKILGVILNRRTMHIPDWLYRML